MACVTNILTQARGPPLLCWRLRTGGWPWGPRCRVQQAGLPRTRCRARLYAPPRLPKAEAERGRGGRRRRRRRGGRRRSLPERQLAKPRERGVAAPTREARGRAGAKVPRQGRAVPRLCPAQRRSVHMSCSLNSRWESDPLRSVARGAARLRGRAIPSLPRARSDARLIIATSGRCAFVKTPAGIGKRRQGAMCERAVIGKTATAVSLRCPALPLRCHLGAWPSRGRGASTFDADIKVERVVRVAVHGVVTACLRGGQAASKLDHPPPPPHTHQSPRPPPARGPLLSVGRWCVE